MSIIFHILVGWSIGGNPFRELEGSRLNTLECCGACLQDHRCEAAVFYKHKNGQYRCGFYDVYLVEKQYIEANVVIFQKARSVTTVDVRGLPHQVSSEYSASFLGENAIDGQTAPGLHNEWATGPQTTPGAWIQISLPGPALVWGARLWFRCTTQAQFTQISFEIDDGSNEQKTRLCNGGNDWLNCAGQPSEHFDLFFTEPTITINITGSGPCPGSGSVGFREIHLEGIYA